MTNLLFTLVLGAAALIASPAFSRADSAVTGRWAATEGVGFGPWTFDLVAEGTKLTGTIRQGPTDGSGWSTGLTAPVTIADGRIEGDTITFTAVNPNASNRRIIFKGRLDGDRIAFEREIEVLGPGPLGRNGIYGKDGAKQFVAKRVSNQPTVETPRNRNVSGRWVAQGVPNGPWTWDLRASGTRVTGTVSQSAGETGPMEIFDGAIDGATVFFKAKSPDGQRKITFTGMINGDEMTILRVIEGRAGGDAAEGVFSASTPPVVIARREPAIS